MMLPWQRTIELLSSLSYRSSNLNRYLEEIALGVSELIDSDWSVITLCQDDWERILASSIQLPDQKQQQLYDLHGTLAGSVVDGNCPLLVDDASCDRQHGEAPEGYRAYLGVPLRTPTGKVIGTICSFGKQAAQFHSQQVELAKLFAERAAIAIDNYELYQQQQQFNQLLQAEIEERKKIEQALRLSEARFRSLVEQAADAIFVIDHKCHIINVNQQACTSLGYNREELQRLCLPDVEKKLTREELLALHQQFTQGGAATLEGIHQRKDGTTFPVEVRVGLLDWGGEKVQLALARDITQRKQTEQITARLAEIGELATMIVHEVRNPLTTVLMGLNSLQQLDLTARFQTRLDLAMDEAERLQRLLNEILLYAKEQQLSREKLEVNAFLAQILNSLQDLPIACQRHLKFQSAPTTTFVWADPDKLKQVIINLVENACEAVTEGEMVQLRVQPEQDHILIAIHNGGAPIPPEILPRLTQPFYTSKPSGNGLGLAIVKRIVVAHGGELNVESNEMAGTTFTVKLLRYE